MWQSKICQMDNRGSREEQEWKGKGISFCNSHIYPLMLWCRGILEKHNHSSCQRIPHLLWILKVITMLIRAPHWTILSKLNPVHALTPYVFKIHFNIIVVSASSVSKSSDFFRFCDWNFMFIFLQELRCKYSLMTGYWNKLISLN